MIESIHTNFLFVWRFKYEEIIRSTVFEFMKTFNSFDSVCKMQLLNILNVSLVAGMVALPITTVQTVQSRVTVARTGTIRTSGHTYRTTTRISHTVPNLSKNAHRSSQMHLATYQKSFLSTFSIFYCNSCRFFVDLFCIFFKLKKTLIFIYPDVNNTFVHKSLD